MHKCNLRQDASKNANSFLEQGNDLLLSMVVVTGHVFQFRKLDD
jgi:hypothetical protein